MEMDGHGYDPVASLLRKGAGAPCRGGWVGIRTFVDGRGEDKISFTHQVSNPVLRTCRKSIYRLLYPGPLVLSFIIKIIVNLQQELPARNSISMPQCVFV
jgi:hypothetical protein